MSYALDSKASQASKRSADFNHFVVFDPYNTIACHDFEVRRRHVLPEVPLAAMSQGAHHQCLQANNQASQQC